MNIKVRKVVDNSMDVEDIEEAENLGGEDLDEELDQLENDAYKKINT